MTLVYRPLFQDAILVSDDYEHHAARLGNYYLAIQQGQIMPRWAPNLNGGFGYPVFNFTYHVPYLVGTVLHVMNASIQESLNGSVLIAVLGGAFGAYLFARSYGLRIRTSWLLAASYMINPYILLTVFWRGALGEVYAYAVVPYLLALLALSQKSELKKFSRIIFLSFIISASVLVLSHMPFAIILFCLSGGGILSHGDGSLKKFFGLGMAISVFLTAWYWMPAILEKSFTSYDSGEYLLQHADQFVPTLQLFDISRSFHSSQFFLAVIQIGITPIVALIVTLHHLYKHERRTHASIWYWLGVIIFSILLIDPISRVLWDTLPPMQMIQFPWRMLVPIHLASLILLVRLSEDREKSLKIIEGFVLISISIAIFGYAHVKGFNTRTDYDWYQATSTTSSSDEHKPVWFTVPEHTLPDIYFYDLQPILSHELETQNLQLNYSSNNGTKQSYSVTVPADGYLIHKRAFFPGWIATVDEESVTIYKDIEPFSGVVAIPITEGKHDVTLIFSGMTSARTGGLVLSGLGVILLFYVLKRQYFRVLL